MNEQVNMVNCRVGRYLKPSVSHWGWHNLQDGMVSVQQQHFFILIVRCTSERSTVHSEYEHEEHTSCPIRCAICALCNTFRIAYVLCSVIR